MRAGEKMGKREKRQYRTEREEVRKWCLSNMIINSVRKSKDMKLRPIPGIYKEIYKQVYKEVYGEEPRE